MDKIFKDANDKNVAATIIYNSSNKAVRSYGANAANDQFEADELLNAFKKGCIIRNNGNYYTPVHAEVAEATGVVTIHFITVGTGGAPALASLTSKAKA